jgi:NADH-quinone oxidoreductase subunit H
VIINEQVFIYSSALIKVFIYLTIPFLIYTVLVSFERKLASRSVGKMGRYKSRRRDYITFAQDLVKIYLKKPVSYSNSSFNRLNLCPAIAFGLSALPLAAIPICEPFLINNQKLSIEILSSNHSLLLFMGLNSLNIFSLLIIGWAVNSNFSILANLKRSMHYLGSELIIFFIIINMIICYGSADLHHIVIMQKKTMLGWINQLGIVIQPVLAIVYIYYLSLSANLLNSKFSLELLNIQQGIGFSLNSMGLILLKFSEQMKFFINGLLFSFLFLGGYGLLPGLSYLVEQYSDSLYVFQVLSLLIKTMLVTFLSIVLRLSSFNMRADQVLKYIWNRIMPLLYINTILTIIFMFVSEKFKWI